MEVANHGIFDQTLNILGKFLESCVKFSKTADYNPEISLDRVIHCLGTASRQSPPSYKDPLTIATVIIPMSRKGLSYYKSH